MPRTSKYSDELWAEALKLYEDPDVGPAEASRRTGIPKGTIASRASRGGVATVRKEKTEAAVEAAMLSRKQRQERLLDSMLEEAQAALDDHRRPYTAIAHHKDGTSETVELRPDPHGRAKLSTSFGILFDKIQ